MWEAYRRNLCQPAISSEVTGFRGLGQSMNSSEARGSTDLGQPTTLLCWYFWTVSEGLQTSFGISLRSRWYSLTKSWLIPWLFRAFEKDTGTLTLSLRCFRKIWKSWKIRTNMTPLFEQTRLGNLYYFPTTFFDQYLFPRLKMSIKSWNVSWKTHFLFSKKYNSYCMMKCLKPWKLWLSFWCFRRITFSLYMSFLWNLW